MDARVPDAFCESVASLLPMQELPGRQGGGPAIPHVVVLKVIWFVLTVGCRWKDIPREFGGCGETARRRLKHWQELGVWQNVHLRLLALLNQRGRLGAGIVLIDSTHVRAFGGGDRSGPSPVDRRKPGTMLTLLTDLRGTPLVLRSSPANSSDHQEILPTVAAYPSIGGLPGRPVGRQTSSSPTRDTTARPPSSTPGNNSPSQPSASVSSTRPVETLGS